MIDVITLLLREIGAALQQLHGYEPWKPYGHGIIDKPSDSWSVTAQEIDDHVGGEQHPLAL
jgi:hypothetical protein